MEPALPWLFPGFYLGYEGLCAVMLWAERGGKLVAYFQCLYAFVACFAFCIVFNVRGKALFFMPLGGAFGWAVYLLCTPLQSELRQYFLGTLALST